MFGYWITPVFVLPYTLVKKKFILIETLGEWLRYYQADIRNSALKNTSENYSNEPKTQREN